MQGEGEEEYADYQARGEAEAEAESAYGEMIAEEKNKMEEQKMESKIEIEVESRDKIMAMMEAGGMDEKREEVDFSKEVHDNLVKCIKDYAEKLEEELPEEFDEGHIEGMDKPEQYGIKIKVKKEKLEPKQEGCYLTLSGNTFTSSNIKSIDYNIQKQELSITFQKDKDNTEYLYPDFDFEDFMLFAKSESKGKHFFKEIKQRKFEKKQGGS